MLQVEEVLETQMTTELHEHYTDGSLTAELFDEVQQEVG